MILSQAVSEVYIALKSLTKTRDVFFWVILFPVILTMLFIGIFARGGEAVHFTIAVESGDTGWFNSTLNDVLASTGIFEVVFVESGLVELVANGSVDAGIYIPEGASTNISQGVQARIEIYYIAGLQESETAKSSLEAVVNVLSNNISAVGIEVLSSFVPGQLVERLRFLSEPVVVEKRVLEPEALATVGGLRSYYSIGIIGIQALYIGIFSSISMVVERRKDRVFPIILSSPVRGWVIFLSDTLAAVLLVFASTAVVMASSLVLGADYSSLGSTGVLASLSLIIVGTLSMIGIGLLVSVLARTSEGATALGNLIAFPLMFLGGLAVPKFILPSELQTLSEWLPLPRIIDAVRGMAVYGYSIVEAFAYAAPAVLASFLVYAIGALVYRRVLTRMAERPY